MSTTEAKEVQQSTASTASKKLYCNGRACVTCGKCCDWRFTGDATTWNWICNYNNWDNNDWKRWRHDRIWEGYERKDGATCTSVSRDCRSAYINPQFGGTTFDDPIFGGHQVVHTVNVFGSYNINASHDFIFVGHQIPNDHHIVSSDCDLCVCNNNP